MSSLLLESRLPQVSDEREGDSTLIVAWQNSESHRISPFGLLAHDHLGCRFRYIRNARDVKDFLPLLGFTDLTTEYWARGRSRYSRVGIATAENTRARPCV